MDSKDKRKLYLIVGMLILSACLINALVGSTRTREAKPQSGTSTAASSQPVSPSPPVIQNNPPPEPAKVFVKADIAKTAGMKLVALVVANEKGLVNQPVSSALASRFKNEGIDISPSALKPSFARDKMFGQIFEDADTVIEKLKLENVMHGVLVARQTVEYSTNAALENIISAHMGLELLAVSLTSGERQAWTFSANGAGFRNQAARALAEERLLSEISSDPTLKFNQSFFGETK